MCCKCGLNVRNLCGLRTCAKLEGCGAFSAAQVAYKHTCVHKQPETHDRSRACSMRLLCQVDIGMRLVDCAVCLYVLHAGQLLRSNLHAALRMQRACKCNLDLCLFLQQLRKAERLSVPRSCAASAHVCRCAHVCSVCDVPVCARTRVRDSRLRGARVGICLSMRACVCMCVRMLMRCRRVHINAPACAFAHAGMRAAAPRSDQR